MRLEIGHQNVATEILWPHNLACQQKIAKVQENNLHLFSLSIFY